MSENQKQKPQYVWERHMQTILTFIITALIAWVGTSVATQRTEIALLQQTVDTMKVQVEDFTKLPRFTKQEFQMEMRLYDSRIRLLEGEIEKKQNFINDTDRRLRTLERKVE